MNLFSGITADKNLAGFDVQLPKHNSDLDITSIEEKNDIYL